MVLLGGGRPLCADYLRRLSLTAHEVLVLTSAAGQCIRFPVTDVRVFQGRTSIGVLGINLAQGDTVISL